MEPASTVRLDVAAIGLSLACAAHCLALPVAAAFLPALSTVVESEWVHWSMLAVAAPVALLALRHRGTPLQVRALAAFGLALMTLGVFGLPAEDWEVALTVGGGSALALAHTLNLLRAHGRRSHGSH